MIELSTYRHIVRNMVRDQTGLELLMDKDGIFTDEAVEMQVRRSYISRDRARDCAAVIILGA